MVNLLGVVIATLVVTVLGGGIGYLLWLKTRPLKQTWNARIYHLGEGVREPVIDPETKKILSDLKLCDLRPYTKDVIELLHKEHGVDIYQLQKLHKVVPPVEADFVDYWGPGDKEVAVLNLKSGCTLMRKGYDKELGEMVFDPLPLSRINLIKSELSIRKDRLQKEKDILQAITPWIVTGICILGLVAMAYIMIDGFVAVADKNKEGMEMMTEMQDDRIKELEMLYTLRFTQMGPDEIRELIGNNST